MQYVTSIQQLIGHTPLMELRNVGVPEGVRLFAKLEYFNPGGSIKDRLGQKLLDHALMSGELKPGGTIIEPTAGNTGIGLALAAIGRGFRVMFVVPQKFSMEKQTLMKALGAEIINTPTEDGMKGAIEKAQELAQELNAFCPQQFDNEANPETYYETLGPEIYDSLDGKVDVFVAGGGTGGTFMGTARFLKEQNPSIKTAIVEPEGSILNGGEAGSHRTEGIGMEFLPRYMDTDYFDSIHTISDLDAFRAVKVLAEKEGLLVASSSGAAFVAAMKEAEQAKPGTHIVTVFPDSSERYLSQGIYEE
ncbi:MULTISPECIES: PLP-dependent cysteine synthase family protein [Pontibacillus]|uniref:Cysteine synthase family protein n=1 Tax=Pontibacillus chungwhensis TaxID=265426 RepID=A0ABY8UYA2_9BACI|nr:MULTISPECIES: cysteine synthase family protein [Pontibacillus]MCD5325361.1 cysteine synthase family protein [Pontibacillus sp. HN14]WIF98479.1 cysteine synthase family protein [Pontibacillus chungwhensis]